jgi:hypothetical protein
MAIQGIFASHSAYVGDRDQSIAGRILRAGFGGDHPMLALSAGTPELTATDMMITWRENNIIMSSALLAANALINATSITLDDSQLFTRNTILQNMATGEQILVTAVNGNVLTIVRGWAGSTPFAMTAGQTLLRTGLAFPEGSAPAGIATSGGENRMNYVQTFRAAAGATGDALHVKLKSGNPLSNGATEARGQLASSMEGAMLFGRPSIGVITENGEEKQVRTMAGLTYAIENWGGQVQAAAANNVAGRLNLKVFTNFVADLFRYNIEGQPNERVVITGNRFLLLLDEMIKDIGGYRYSVGEDKYGLRVKTLVTPVGDLVLKTHPMFNEAQAALGTRFIAFHPGGLERYKFRPLTSTPVKGLQTDGVDVEKVHILTSMTAAFKGNRCNGMLTGVQTAGGLAALPSA